MDLLKAIENTNNKGTMNDDTIAEDEEDDSTEDDDCTESTRELPTMKKLKVVDYLKISLLPSSTEDKGYIKIGNTIFSLNGRILFPKEILYSGKVIKNRRQCRPLYQWSSTPPHPKLVPVRNIAPYVSGAIGAAREIETELAAFDIYVTESMLQTILTHTNDEIKIAQYYISPPPDCVYPSSMTELKAFIGILFLSAVKKDARVSTSFLWGVCGSDIYSTVMTKERYEYLTQCLRFDEYSTRDYRKRQDSFSQIREIWDNFITKCSEVFRPSVNCTIDEIFVDYNGICSFKLPSSRQPQKYGIKLILLCDSNNRYVMSGVPYLNKNKNCQPSLAEYFVEKLATSIRGTNINITYGNDWFNSISLSKKMVKVYKITSIGTLNKNSYEIPADMLITENRPENTSIIVYNVEDELQLCTHYSNTGEVDIILSTKHFEPMKNSDRKPKVMKYYESTKDGVDAIRKLCYSYSCSRQTKHWFSAIFYTILDLAGINSLTVLNLNRSRCGKPPVRRVDFLYKLALDLMLPHLSERLTDPNINDSMRNKIMSIINERRKINMEINPPKYSVRQIKDMYHSNSASTSKQTKLTIHQVKDMYPPVRHATQTKTISAIQNLEANAGIMQQGEDMRPLIKWPTLNTDIPYQTVNWNEIQDLYPPAQPKNPVLSFAPGLFTWQIQASYPQLQFGIGILPIIPYHNFGWNPVNFTMGQMQLYMPFQSAIPFQGASPFLNINWNIPKTAPLQARIPPKQSIKPTQTNEIKPVLSRKITKQSSFSTQTDSELTTLKSIAEERYEEIVCGICNSNGDKKFFVECAKCSVWLCMVHRKILCLNCFDNIPVTSRSTILSKKGRCGICKPQGLLLYSVQCSKCSKFLCLDHRQMLCCFCCEV